MPYERITAEEFGQWNRRFEGIDFNLKDIDFSHTTDERQSEAACAGGACLVL
jgi:hypothetical protein